MGFFRGPDKIGQLSHSGGIITLGLPALSTVNRYTIRGQQYDFGSLTRTISADVTLTANTLYFIYAHVISGVVNLRISASAPSVYKLANPTSDLIGAFYANGGPPLLTGSPAQTAIGFGSFVTITGSPRTLNPIDSHFDILGETSNPTKATTRIHDLLQWWREGYLWRGYYRYRHDSPTGAVNGTGSYVFSRPQNIVFESVGFPVSGSGTTDWQTASGFGGTSGPLAFTVRAYDTGTGKVGFTLFSFGTPGFAGSTLRALASESQYIVGFQGAAFISGWSETPLKDL